MTRGNKKKTRWQLLILAVIILSLSIFGFSISYNSLNREATELTMKEPVSWASGTSDKYYNSPDYVVKSDKIIVKGYTEPDANIEAHRVETYGSESSKDKPLTVKLNKSTGEFSIEVKKAEGTDLTDVYISSVVEGKKESVVGINIKFEPKKSNKSSESQSKSSSSDSEYIQKLTQDEMGYEHGYIDGYYGYNQDSYGGEFGDGYDRGYQTGWYDAQNDNRPEWEFLGEYNQWSPSDVAYYDTRTNQIV